MYNPACVSAGIPARTSPPASHTRLRNGCRYHVYGRCQARPRRREQVRLQGHPRLRGRAQEGGRRPRHPPGTNTGDAPARTGPGDGRKPRDDRASAHASRRAPRSKRARVPGVVAASTPRTRGGTGSRDVSKNTSHRTDPGSSASRAERICPRIAARASRGERGIPSALTATRASRGVACDARVRRPSPRARPGARPRSGSAPRASTGSLSTRCRLESELALGPGPVEPWFLESRAGSAKKRKTFRALSGIFFRSFLFTRFFDVTSTDLRSRTPRP